MKITFEECLNGKEWIHAELMNSLTGDLISKATDDGFYEVKLLVNDTELEPKFFNKIMKNLEHYIEQEAKKIVAERLQEAENRIDKLSEMLKGITQNISDDYNLDVNLNDDDDDF